MALNTHGMRGLTVGRQGMDMRQAVNPFRAPGQTPMKRGPGPQAAKAAERARGPRVRGRFGLGGSVDVTA